MVALNLQIFWVFFRVGWLSFGGVFGVLPELERMVVFEKNWISSAQFIQAYVVGQFVPGPNMAMCTVIGYWVNGIPGMAAAFLGIYSVPVILMSVAYILYRKGRENELVKRGEAALRPVLLGLFAASALRLWWAQMGAENFAYQMASMALLAAALIVHVRFRAGSLGTLAFGGALWYAMHIGLLFAA